MTEAEHLRQQLAMGMAREYVLWALVVFELGWAFVLSWQADRTRWALAILEYQRWKEHHGVQ